MIMVCVNDYTAGRLNEAIVEIPSNHAEDAETVLPNPDIRRHSIHVGEVYFFTTAHQESIVVLENLFSVGSRAPDEECMKAIDVILGIVKGG